MIAFDPRLPEELAGAAVQDHAARHPAEGPGHRHGELFTVEDGEQVELTVRGKLVQVTPDETVVVPLDGQGPRLPGDPPAWSRDGVRRSDGTVITASVPHAGSL